MNMLVCYVEPGFVERFMQGVRKRLRWKCALRFQVSFSLGLMVCITRIFTFFKIFKEKIFKLKKSNRAEFYETRS